MNWVKLGDSLPEHPRAIEAGPEAMWLYVAAICYSNRLQTDGNVPALQVPRLTTHPDNLGLANRLVQVGLWSASDDSFQVLKYDEWQRTRAELKELRAQKAKAGRRGGLAKARNTKQTPSTVLEQNASTPVELGASKRLAARSTKKRREEEENKTKGLKDKSGATHADAPLFESFWAEYPRQPDGLKPEKKQAHDQWQRLKPTERQQAFDSVQHYKTHLKQTEQFSKHAFRYLRDRSFEAFLEPPQEVVNAPPKGRNARNFDSVIQRLGVANGADASTTDNEVPLRGLPQGRLE